MAYDEKLADRARELITRTHNNVEEKRMFGGLCFMVNGKMCVGVETNRLMVRFDPARQEEIMEMDGAKPMDFTTKVMKGYTFVDKESIGTKKKLEFWIGLALEYNAIAKSSEKKKK
jgi:TfoX/Sxy family transcriptional regulator of competence genes